MSNGSGDWQSVLIERISDIKTDIIEIKNDMRSVRDTQGSINNTIATHTANLERQRDELDNIGDDLSEVKDRLVHLEYNSERIRKRAVQVGSVGGGAGLLSIIAWLLQVFSQGK